MELVLRKIVNQQHLIIKQIFVKFLMMQFHQTEI